MGVGVFAFSASGSEGWKSGVVRQIEDVRARWNSGNKENRNTVVEINQDGSVLGDFECRTLEKEIIQRQDEDKQAT